MFTMTSTLLGLGASGLAMGLTATGADEYIDAAHEGALIVNAQELGSQIQQVCASNLECPAVLTRTGPESVAELPGVMIPESVQFVYAQDGLDGWSLAVTSTEAPGKRILLDNSSTSPVEEEVSVASDATAQATN